MQATGLISPVEQLTAARAAAAAGSFPLAIGTPPPQVAAPPESLWRLALPYAWRYRWMLVLCGGLNACAGVAIALQAFAPKYLVDGVLAPVGLTMNDRYERLAIGVGVYLALAVLMRMFGWY